MKGYTLSPRAPPYSGGAKGGVGPENKVCHTEPIPGISPS